MNIAAGHKHDLLFLPGLLSDERFWQPQVDQLEENYRDNFNRKSPSFRPQTLLASLPMKY